MEFSTRWDGESRCVFAVEPMSEIDRIFLDDVPIPIPCEETTQGKKVFQEVLETRSVREMDEQLSQFAEEVNEIYSRWIKQVPVEDAREVAHVILYRALYGWDNTFDDARLDVLLKKLKEQPDKADKYLEKVHHMAKRILGKAFDFSDPNKLAEDEKSLENTEGFLGCTDDLLPWQIYSVRDMALKLWHREESLRKTGGVREFLVAVTKRFPRKDELVK